VKSGKRYIITATQVLVAGGLRIEPSQLLDQPSQRTTLKEAWGSVATHSAEYSLTEQRTINDTIRTNMLKVLSLRVTLYSTYFTYLLNGCNAMVRG
jgi:hypothetical protein